MKFLVDCIKGIAIGSGAILPGISSGVFLVIFGLYEKFLDSILNFFKYPKENFKFLLPFAVGIVIGILIFSNILNYFFIEFPNITRAIFVVLIMSSIPKLIKETNKQVPFKYHYLLFTFLAFGVGVISVILENSITTDVYTNFSFLYLVLSGFAMSIGIIVPGVSSTVILMLFKAYPLYLSSISTIYLPVLIPMGIGLVLGSFVFMKITNFLLKHFYAQTFYSIIGFTLGSILVLMPFFSS